MWGSMKRPTNSEELAQAIQSLVAEYVEAGQQAATRAVEEAFAGGRAGRRQVRAASSVRRRSAAASPRRRTQAELVALTERLFDTVRSSPGEGMARFAEQLGVSSAELQYPMNRLRNAGRVRSVGERYQTRYFPTVGAKR